MVKANGVALVAGALAMGLVSVSSAHGQEARPAPDIRMLLTQPSNQAAPVSPPPPDVRELPQVKMDKLSDHLPVTIILSEPRCLPGEDDFIDPRQLNRSRSRRSR
jgi:hypothetical protein